MYGGDEVVRKERGRRVVGRIPASEFGWKLDRQMPVEIELNISHIRRARPQQSVTHEPVTDVVTISLQGQVKKPFGNRESPWCGQITDACRRFDAELADVWDRWHLNDMRAGCAHQTVVMEPEPFRSALVPGTKTSSSRAGPCGLRSR